MDLSPRGLAYAGLADHSNLGGRYTVGFQTIEAFLAEGELTGDMPGDITAAIRAHLEVHRRASSGSTARWTVRSARCPRSPG